MRSSLTLAAALFLAAVAPAHAVPLGEKAAVDKVVRILKGDPYGRTDAEVVANLKDRRLEPRDATVCGGGHRLVWSFRVVVPAPGGDPASPIDGWIVIDASSGSLVCATLPFLD